MKEYHSILPKVFYGTPIYMFQKFDGSNVRAEWKPKSGFYKFGSRHVLMDETHPHLGPAVNLIKSKYEKELSDIFRKERYQEVTCFFEYYGPNSFCGNHVLDEPHTVTLIDMSIYKQGIISPRDFYKEYSSRVDTAKMIYYGNVTQEIEEQIRSGTFPEQTFEGVVCKAVPSRKQEIPLMFKIKNRAWIEKLKSLCKDDISLFEKLV